MYSAGMSNFVVNGGFETWTGNTPEGWKSTNTASNATLSQSTDAHSGSYSVKVGFNLKQNKRLGSKEYTLAAGNYIMTFWVKGAGQVRPGYAPTVDGKLGNYVYGQYTDTKDEWTKVTYEFSLDATTVVNFVVMNPKNFDNYPASDKLIDDFSVVKK